MRFLFLAAALVLLPVAAHAACSADASPVEAARKAMLALPTGDGSQTDVSPAGRAAIAKMKGALAAFVGATLQCTAADATDAAILKSLSVAAHPADQSNRDPAGENYGYYVFFGVSHPRKPAPDNLLAITATFQIECGDDAMLLIFARDGTRWRPVTRLQSAPYETIAGAWWSFDYAISPPDASGKWLVAAKSVSPWCSSTWSEIHYGAFRPTDDAQKPKQIFAGSDSIWWGGDDMGRLAVGVNYFDLRFHAESMDPDVHNREWIRDYRFAGDKAARMPPFALNAADFADEWARLGWADAQRLTSQSAARDLEADHASAHKAGYFTYRSVRLCTGGDIQVEVAPVDGEDAPHRYFLIEGPRPQYFRMKNIFSRADPHCTGVNSYKPPG